MTLNSLLEELEVLVPAWAQIKNHSQAVLLESIKTIYLQLIFMSLNAKKKI
jgi:hypothetical protein